MLEDAISCTVTANNGTSSNSSNSGCESDKCASDLCNYYYYYYHYYQEIDVLFQKNIVKIIVTYISSTSLGTDYTTWRKQTNHYISRYANDWLLNVRKTFHRPKITAPSTDWITLLYRALPLLQVT